MEPKYSSTCSQNGTTGLNSQPVESDSKFPVIFRGSTRTISTSTVPQLRCIFFKVLNQVSINYSCLTCVLHVPPISLSLILSPWWGVVYRSVASSVAVCFQTETVDSGDRASDLYSAGERFEPRPAGWLSWLRIFMISSAPPTKCWNDSFNRSRLFHSSLLPVHDFPVIPWFDLQILIYKYHP
jgi:hypothetical protein